ncbi:MAG TPA: hypothetical protein VF258_04870 [Luteolibacter sp.]
MSATESEEVLRLLLADRTPDQQARLQAGWEKYASGNPESGPAIFALAQLFVMDAHAAMLDRQSGLLDEFQGICQKERQEFQQICAKERKATLDGFEKRQAVFEKNQHASIDNRAADVPEKNGFGALALAVATLIGLLGGGYAMNHYNQKQFRETADVGQKMVESIRAAGGDISHRVAAGENRELFQLIEVTAPTGKPRVFLTEKGHAAVTFKQPNP